MKHPPYLIYLNRSLAGALLLLCHGGKPATASEFGPKAGVECFLIEKASIFRVRREKSFGRANAGHQITRGSKTVLAVRTYEDGGGGPDNQSFKKATIEFAAPPDLAAGQAWTVPILRSYYSEGASGFVGEGGYAWASNPFVQFQLIRTANGFSIKLNDNIEAIKEFPPQKRHVMVAWSCPVTNLTVGQLDPWQGKVGTTYGAFFPNRDDENKDVSR